jgi:translocation and assembly module TamB
VASPRALRILRKGAKIGWRVLRVAIGGAIALVAALGLILYLDLAFTRRFVVRITNRALLPVFQGRLILESLGKLHYYGIDGARVRVVDPAGHGVFVVDGLRARIVTMKLVRGLLASPLRIDLDIPVASIDHVDFLLDTDAAGVPLVAAAFTPVPSTQPSASPTSPGPEVNLVISHASIAHAWVHGVPTWFPAIDADLSDVDAKVVVRSSKVFVDVRHASLGARGLPVGSDGSGTLHGHVYVPSENGNTVGLDASFRGNFAGVDHSAHFSMDGDLVSAELDLKEVAPEKIRPFVPAYPLEDVLSAHVGARGTLPTLDVDLRAELRGGGSLVASGQTTLAENKTLTLHTNLAAIDLRGFGPGLPSSSLAAGVDATLAIDADAVVTGQATLVSEGGTVGSQVLPAARIQATFAHGARFGNRAEATVTFHEPGLSGRAALRLSPKRKSYELVFDAHAEAPRLDGIKRLGLPFRGSVHASAAGTLSFDTLLLAADIDAQGDHLEQPATDSRAPPTFAIEAATAKAHASGSIFLPVIDATVHAESIDLLGIHADKADVTAKGPVNAPHVHAILLGGEAPEVDADTDLKIGAKTIFQKIRATVSRDKEAADVRADSVNVTGDTVSGDNISLLGLGGAAHGEFRLAPHTLEVVAAGQGVDLAALSRVAGLTGWCQRGQLGFNVDAKIRGKHAEGHALVDLTDASIADVDGASVHADVMLHDQRIGGHLHAELGDIGAADIVATNVEMGEEGPRSLRAWERMKGQLQFNASVDLARVDAVLPADELSFDVTRGRLEIAGMMRRSGAADDAPQLAFTVKTSGLVVEGKAPVSSDPRKSGATLRARAPWKIEGVDLGIDARVEGETGFAELAGRLADAKGPLVALDVKSLAMPFAALLANPVNARELLSKVIFDGHLIVPKRDLSTLPPVVDLGGAEGVLDADLALKGTFSDPELDLKASLEQGGTNSVRFSLPFELALAAHYAEAKADGTLTAEAGKRGEVLKAEGHMEGRLVDIVAKGSLAPWRAWGRAHLEKFPLGALGFLEDRQVHGELTGDAELKDFHKDASATVDLAMTGAKGLEIGEVSYKDVHLHANLDGQAVDITAHMAADPSRPNEGVADLHAHAGETWGDALKPRLSEKDPLDLSLTTRQFRAETLLPFAHDTLAELEGRVTGNAHLGFDPKDGRPKLDGKLLFEHGRFEFGSALGEFHDATATLLLTPDGLATIQNAKASGVTGTLEAAASARIIMDPVNGLSLGAARASLRIPSKGSIPVIVEGTPLGSIDGMLTVSEDPIVGSKGMKVAVEIPTLHVVLPQSGTRNVQPLGDIEDARIEARRGVEVVEIPLGPAGDPQLRAADAKRIEITAHLGDDIEIRQGQNLKVGLSGQAAVVITDKARVSGQLRLKKGGVLFIEGKTFEIESGSVSFTGDDPSNPQVVVTAGWTAPEGTRILADYLGPLKTGKVTLRSQPSLPQSDIVALLLFGAPEGSAGTAGAVAQGQGEGIAGNAATQPLNHALDQFGVHAVSARVDTSQAASPKPEVELQVAKDISVQIAVVIGTPPPGSNPDTTLLTLNWRFLKAMTLSTTVGNSGSSIVDMVWQRRY